MDGILLSEQLTLNTNLFKGNAAVAGQGGNGQGSGHGGKGGDTLRGDFALDPSADAPVVRGLVPRKVAKGNVGTRGLGSGVNVGGRNFNLGSIDVDLLNKIFANETDVHEDWFVG